MSEAEAKYLYNMSMNALDVQKCEHNELFVQCSKCRDKTSSMWLLDSGASAHFTYDKSYFINFKPATGSNRIAVRTAAPMIYVEGHGTVLLKHIINHTLVTTRVHPVLYIPQMSTRLLSMGEFLQEGMRALGTARSIIMLNKTRPFFQCKPIVPGQTLYWLEASSMQVEAQFIESPLILKVDYDLMHRRLGHPSKDVLRHAKDHTKGILLR
jgi:hypothetical protein